MDNYEKEIYHFLIQRENFEAMLKVNSHFAMVKEELLNSFWNLVADNIKEQINVISDKLVIFNPSNKDRGDAKVIIYKEEWKREESHPFVGLAWEHLFTNTYYGVWSNMHSAKIDSQKLKSALDSLRINISFKVDANWWPLWQYGKYNFSTDNNIAFILPDRANIVAEEYASLLVSLFAQTEKIIDSVLDAT